MDRLDKIGKVKLNMDTLGDDERKKLKCKTLAYVMIELISALIVIFAILKLDDDLKLCDKANYSLWIRCVLGYNLVGLFLHIFTYVMIIKKRYKVWLVVLASLIELGMIILSLYSLVLR